MISVIEVCSIVVAVTAVGIGLKLYLSSQSILRDVETKVAAAADSFAASTRTIAGAATTIASASAELTSVVARHEKTVADSLKQAITSSILTTRPASAVELKQQGR